MSDLIRRERCPICGCPDWWMLASEEELAEQLLYQERLLRQLVPPDSPSSARHDLTVFTNSYDARLVVCCHCGLVCRDPHFSLEGSLRAFGRDDYPTHWLERTHREYERAFSVRIDQLIPLLGRKARVLEVGSYVGGFLAAAKDKGWDATGVDVGSRVSHFSRSKGLQVYTGTLHQAEFPDANFDAVFVWVCFDQLPAPREDLKEIARVLRRNGSLYIQVPNGDFVKMMHRLQSVLPRKRVHESILEALAFTGLAGFPYQLGYTTTAITRLLRQSGFRSVRLRNRINIADVGQSNQPVYFARRQAVARKILWASHVIRLLSLGKWLTAPWMEISCRNRPD